MRHTYEGHDCGSPSAVQGGVGGLPGTGFGRGMVMEAVGARTLFLTGGRVGAARPTFHAGQRIGTAAFTDVFAVAEFWATCTGQMMSLTPETRK